MSSGPSTPPTPQAPGGGGSGFMDPGNPSGLAGNFKNYQAGYAPIQGTCISAAQQTPYQQGLTPEQFKKGLGKLDTGMGMAAQSYKNLGQMQGQFQQNANNAGNAAYNPAIGAYQQALNQNSQNIGAQLASQRGSSVNPGMAARNVGQAGASAAQNAAGQMSSQVAAYKGQEQGLALGAGQAQGNMAGVYGNIANAYSQAGLQNQGQMLNAIAAQNAAAVAMQSNMNSSRVAMQSNMNSSNVGMMSNYNDVMANQQMNNNRLGTEQYGMGLNYNASIYGDQMQASSAQNQNYQNNGLLGLPIPILSDKRSKTDIKPAGSKVDKFLRAISASEYKYKNPKEPGAAAGRHVSPMAQELEKTELGKSMVVNQGGRKMVDYQRGLGTILAAQARLNQRLDSVEKVQKFAKGGMVKPKKMSEGGFSLGVCTDLSKMGGCEGPSKNLEQGGGSPYSLGMDTNFGEQAGIPQGPQPQSMLGQIMGGLANRQIGQMSGGKQGGGTMGMLAGMGMKALIGGGGAAGGAAAGGAAEGGAGAAALAAAHGGMIPARRYAQGGPIQPDTQNPNYQPPLAQIPPQSPQISSPNMAMQSNINNANQSMQGNMMQNANQAMRGQIMGQGPSMQNFALAGSPNPAVAMPSSGMPMGNAQTRGGGPMPGLGQSGNGPNVAMQSNVNNANQAMQQQMDDPNKQKGGVGMPLLSDRRAKTDIRPAGEKIDRFLRALSQAGR